MAQQSTKTLGCKDVDFDTSPFNGLTRISSTKLSNPSLLLAQSSAFGLVLASAGLGGVYAWTTGSHHGPALGGLMVVMAVALEVAKPMALASAFTAFRSWAIARGVGLALMAAVAITYSLSAELSLMAGARGDVVAERQSTLDTSISAAADATRARERYDAAKAELTTLAPSRPSPEVQAEIDALLLTPGADGCVAIDGKVSARVCPQVATLKIEKARSDRRAELEGILAAPLAVVPTARDDNKSVGDADPGASALATYLAILGITVPTDALSKWLALVPVLALEVGSALAVILVQSAEVPQRHPASGGRMRTVTRASDCAPAVPVVHPINADAAATRERVKAAILNQLEKQGGSVASSERGLAALIGASRPTLRRAINGLVLAGIIAAEASRNGTMLRLVS